MGDLWTAILNEALSRARSRAPLPIDPTGGFDNAPVISPVVPVNPWTLNFGGHEATLSLPANKGANFEGYANYNFNPFSPRDFRVNQLGLRYRYEF